MNRIKITFTTAVFLLFAAFTYAQEPSQEPTPPQHEQPASAPEPSRELAPPAQQPDVAPPAHPNEARPPRQQEEAKPPRQEKPEKPEAQQKPEPRDQNKPAHEQHGQQPQKGQQAQTGQHARPAGKSAHIPDPKFKASFGREHHFTVNRVINQTTIVPGQTQFVYVGYTFIILDPWPAEWAFTDDVYIDYVDDGYFLFDVLHPGIRVVLFVVG